MAKPVPYSHLRDITIDFEKANVQELRDILTDYGVCIIQNVLTNTECEDIASKAVGSLEKLGRGADRNVPSKFGTDNTIPQTRAGMYQTCYANNKDVNWVVRCHSNVERVFLAAYSTASDQHTKTALAQDTEIANAPTDLMVSGDGLTVLPNRPYKETGDWAHLDQMHTKLFHSEEFANYQGQIGMTNCKHTFRVSVGSHKVHKDIVDLLVKEKKYPEAESNRLAKKKSPAGFLKLPVDLEDDICNLVENECKKNQYQCLIPAKRGSLILWDARCIHSSYRHPEPEPETAEKCSLNGWRCIVYVSFRRKAFMSRDDKKVRADALLLNDTTSHWGMTKLRTMQRSKLPDDVQKMFSSPVLIYGQVYSPPPLTTKVKYLTCISDMLEAEPEIYGRACTLYEEGKYSDIKDLLRPARAKTTTKKKSSDSQSRIKSALKKLKKA